MHAHIINVRPPPRMVTTTKRNKSWTTPQYPHNGGVVIAYLVYPNPDGGPQVAALGAAVSSPTNGCFHGAKLKRIARARLEDSPVRLQFDGFGPKLRGDHIRSAFRALLIEEPKWRYVDNQVLRPGRFTQRWGASLLGPDGSLLTAFIDFLHRPRWAEEEARRGNAVPLQRALCHWVLRMPAWIREVV